MGFPAEILQQLIKWPEMYKYNFLKCTHNHFILRMEMKLGKSNRQIVIITIKFLSFFFIIFFGNNKINL